MRNLKKVLSLALALVMLLGMMVVGAGAATSFSDDDKIADSRKVAVAVANKIGVLQGVGDNTFNPDGTLTRAEAAVVLAKLDLGADAAKALTATNAATFNDVGTGYGWAKAYIDYCAGNGYMVGVGGNNFAPGRTLTSVEFATMVCRVLGYKDENEYGKDGWTAVKAAALARKAGLGTDVSVGNNQMTRADMAQMVLNALTAPLVEYEGLNVSVNGVSLTSNVKVRTHTGSLTSNNTTYDYQPIQSNITPIRLCEEKFPDLKLTTDEDAFGRVESVWSWKRVNIAGSENPVAANFEFTEKKSSVSINGAEGGKVYVNGKDETPSDKTVDAGYIAGLTDNGRLVQVYLQDDNHLIIKKVVVVDTYVARVTAVNSAKETVTVSTLGGTPGSVNLTAKKDFASGDLVTYTAAYNGSTKKYDIQDMDALEIAATGTLTKWVGKAILSGNKGNSKSSFTVGGETYKYSANPAFVEADGSEIDADTNIAAFTVNKSELNVYLDKYGFAIYVSGVEGEKNYAAVIGVGSSNTHGSQTVGVTLLLADNTTKEVTAKFMNVNPSDYTKRATGDYENPDGTAQLVRDSVGDVVSYTIGDNDVYELTILDDNDTTNGNLTGLYDNNGSVVGGTGSDNGARSTFLNGKSELKLGATTYYTTSKTVFFVATKDTANNTYTYAAYTGYANMPSFDSKDGITGYAYTTNRLYSKQIDAIYVSVNQLAGVNAVDAYFVKAKNADIITDSTGASYYELPAIVDGEKTTIKIAVNANLAAIPNNDTEGVFAIKNVRKNSGDVVTAYTKVAFSAANGVLGTVRDRNAVLGIGSSISSATYWAYTSNTKIYSVDKDYTDILESSINQVQTDNNDLVYADQNSNTKTLTNVFIVDRPEGAGTVATYSVSVSGSTANMTYSITDGTTIKNNVALTGIAKNANVTVTFKANAGYVFANGKDTYEVKFTGITADQTVAAPTVTAGVQKVNLSVKLGTGVDLIAIGSDTYGNGKAIVGEKGDVLVIQAKKDGSVLNTGVVLQFQGADSSTDKVTIPMNAAHEFIVTLDRDGTLFVTANANEVAKLAFEDAKTRIESRTFDLWYAMTDNNSSGLMRGPGISYFDNANGVFNGNTWSKSSAYQTWTGNGIEYKFSDDVEKAALYGMLLELTRAEGDGYELNPQVTTSSIYISDASMGSYGVDPDDPTDKNRDTGISGPTKDGDSYVFTRTVTIMSKGADGKVKTATGSEGAWASNVNDDTVVGNVKVRYKMTPMIGTPEDWEPLAAPVVTDIKSANTVGNASAKTVNIVNNTQNWKAGVYRLYKEDGTNIMQTDGSPAHITLAADGTALNFTTVEGLQAGPLKVKLGYYGDANGERDVSALSDVITVTVS